MMSIAYVTTVNIKNACLNVVNETLRPKRGVRYAKFISAYRFCGKGKDPNGNMLC
jgi:hypothetical protein